MRLPAANGAPPGTHACRASLALLLLRQQLHVVPAVEVAQHREQRHPRIGERDVRQLLGAGERGRAGVAAYKGIRASALLGLTGTALGIFAGRPIFALMNPDPAAVETGAAYLSIVLAGSPFLLVGLTCEGIMRASGDTRTPLLIDLFAVSLNAVLDPFLIYGWGPAPRLGVAGAAWATVIAQVLMVGFYVVAAVRRHPAFPLARRAPPNPR